MNTRLEAFYPEVRSEKGNELALQTLSSIRAGIARHIKNPPWERQVNILADTEFTSSNRMFLSVIKRLKRNGHDHAKHHDAIQKNDLERLRKENAFDWQNNPVQLQEKVFFDTQLHLGRRGRENLADLKKDSFIFKMDEDGNEFAEINYHEFTKNHRQEEKQLNKPRIYETKTNTCPLASLKLYMSKLNPDCDRFYQKARSGKKFDPKLNDTWYTPKPIGKNTLGDFMKKISKRLCLSSLYTNHCIRATCVTEMARGGFEARQIMKVTGHRSEVSLQTYDQDNSSSKKKDISAYLAGKINETNQNQSVQCTSTQFRGQNIFNITGNFYAENCTFSNQ